MDWDEIEQNWKQVQRKIRAKWDKLTDDDLRVIDGRREQLEVILHKRYGFASNHIRKEIDDWLRWQTLHSTDAQTHTKR